MCRNTAVRLAAFWRRTLRISGLKSKAVMKVTFKTVTGANFSLDFEGGAKVGRCLQTSTYSYLPSLGDRKK